MKLTNGKAGNHTQISLTPNPTFSAALEILLPLLHSTVKKETKAQPSISQERSVLFLCRLFDR